MENVNPRLGMCNDQKVNMNDLQFNKESYCIIDCVHNKDSVFPSNIIQNNAQMTDVNDKNPKIKAEKLELSNSIKSQRSNTELNSESSSSMLMKDFSENKESNSEIICVPDEGLVLPPSTSIAETTDINVKNPKIKIEKLEQNDSVKSEMTIAEFNSESSSSMLLKDCNEGMNTNYCVIICVPDEGSVLPPNLTKAADIAQKNDVNDKNPKINAKNAEKNNSVKSDKSDLTILLNNRNEDTDNEDAEWNSVRNLTTDQQRYEHVRKCWGSRKVPDPNKDLTFPSFMKKRLLCENENFQEPKKQHKRVATHSPCKRDTKRQRTNVDYFNSKMDLVAKQTKKEKDSLNQRYHMKMESSRQKCINQMSHYYNMNYYMPAVSEAIAEEWNHKKFRIYHDHASKIEMINQKQASDLEALEKVKEEVSRFNEFYQGLDVGGDPTLLTEKQSEELKEIDQMYNMYELYYNKKVY